MGSPNAILRRGINGTVIVRTGRRIPGVNPMMGLHAPISVVRMAVDDPYEATFESILEGTRTAELGGSAGTREFADEVIRPAKTKLEVWSALA